MKKLILCIAVLSCAMSVFANVDYMKLNVGGTGGSTNFVMAVGSGQIITVLRYANTYPNAFRFEVTYGDTGNWYDIEVDMEIEGPATVRLYSRWPVDIYEYAEAVVKIKDTVALSPMNIISLPSDNNGDVDIVIETSTDLQSWTPVYSGSAGTSNTAAFFRTRLIQN